MRVRATIFILALALAANSVSASLSASALSLCANAIARVPFLRAMVPIKLERSQIDAWKRRLTSTGGTASDDPNASLRKSLLQLSNREKRDPHLSLAIAEMAGVISRDEIDEALARVKKINPLKNRIPRLWIFNNEQRQATLLGKRMTEVLEKMENAQSGWIDYFVQSLHPVSIWQNAKAGVDRDEKLRQFIWGNRARNRASVAAAAMKPAAALALAYLGIYLMGSDLTSSIGDHLEAEASILPTKFYESRQRVDTKESAARQQHYQELIDAMKSLAPQ